MSDKEGEAKNVKVTVRLSSRQYALLSLLARDQGEDLSSFIRSVLSNFLVDHHKGP